MNELKDWLTIISSVVMLIGMIFLVYKTFRDPDIKTENELGIMQERCKLKHEGIDKDIGSINKNLSLLKENHINHIEADVKRLNDGQIKLFTMLDERLPKK